MARLFSRWNTPTPLRRRLVETPHSGLSPLTGREVQGWRWQVFLRDPLATEKEVLVLDEEWRPNTSYESTGVWLEMEPLKKEDFVVNEAARQQFLRKRGIFWDEGGFVWKESILLSSADLPST